MDPAPRPDRRAPRRAKAGAAVLAGLAEESAELHRAFSEHHDTGYTQNGFLSAFDTIARLDAAHAQAAPGTTRLGGAEACELCPQLAARPAGALFDPTAAHCDPKRFADATLAAGRELGVRVETGVEVLRIRGAARREASLSTTSGELRAGEIVIAAGAWSPRVAADLGIAVPIQGAKGYHVEFAANGDDARIPTYFPERRVVATPLEGRIRVSGMLQICGTDLGVDEGRLGVVTAQARELLNGLATRPVRRVWRGLRPCTPDGLPLVGRVPGVANVTLATGHGMWGLQLAPVTGRLVSDLLRGEPDLDRLHPLRAERFSRRPGARALAL